MKTIAQKNTKDLRYMEYEMTKLLSKLLKQTLHYLIPLSLKKKLKL